MTNYLCSHMPDHHCQLEHHQQTSHLCSQGTFLRLQKHHRQSSPRLCSSSPISHFYTRYSPWSRQRPRRCRRVASSVATSSSPFEPCQPRNASYLRLDQTFILYIFKPPFLSSTHDLLDFIKPTVAGRQRISAWSFTDFGEHTSPLSTLARASTVLARLLILSRSQSSQHINHQQLNKGRLVNQCPPSAPSHCEKGKVDELSYTLGKTSSAVSIIRDMRSCIREGR